MTQFNSFASFGGNAITVRWGDLKFLAQSNGTQMYFAESDESYSVFTQVGSMVFNCRLIKTAFSSQLPWNNADYTQAQNDLDTVDFSLNFKDMSNTPPTNDDDDTGMKELLESQKRIIYLLEMIVEQLDSN